MADIHTNPSLETAGGLEEITTSRLVARLARSRAHVQRQERARIAGTSPAPAGPRHRTFSATCHE